MVHLSSFATESGDFLRRLRRGEEVGPVDRRQARSGGQASLREGCVVTVFPDFGDKYLSTNLWVGWQSRGGDIAVP